MLKIIFLLLITCIVNFVSPDLYSASNINKTQVKKVSPKKAALILDCTNINKKPIVLYQQSANEIRHPASLTKIMTVYLLLEAIQNKKVTFNTKFKVSRFATKQMPSKLNLKEGETISVLDCIKALLVKSANDVAVVVAEGLAGSVPAFCNIMNKKAKSLGMKSTHYENPSGVPNIKQITCANDIAILGLSLMNRFPQYWYLFSLKNFTYKNKTHGTHCKILRWYNGADGAKTGYICASGFNLWVTANKFNKEGKSKRLFAIIFGERSGKERDFKAARLLDSYFKDYNIVNNNKSLNELKNKANNKINKDNKTNNIDKNNKQNIKVNNDKSNKINNNIVNKKIKNNNTNNQQINNKQIENNLKNKVNEEVIHELDENIIYELESFPINDIIKSSGKTKEYFDDLYKDDIPLQVESSTPIDFTNNQSKSHSNTKLNNNKKQTSHKLGSHSNINNSKKKINNKKKPVVKNNKKQTIKKNNVKDTNKIIQKQAKINNK